jgi:hypothetical protein
MKPLLLSLILLIPFPCWARLNETFEQSVARYGEAISGSIRDVTPDCRQAEFWKDSIWIRESFLKGTCVQIEFAHASARPTSSADVAFPPIGTPFFTEGEIQTLLDQNSQGHHWSDAKRVTSDSGVSIRCWGRDDGAFASEADFQMFSVKLPAFDDYTAACDAANLAKEKIAAQSALKNL